MKSYCKEKNIEVLIPADMDSSLSLSQLPRQMKNPRVFPLAPSRRLRDLHNKWIFSNFLEKNSLPQPRTFLIAKRDDLEKLTISYPAMIKPLEMHGGEGVVRVDSKKDAYRYLSIRNKRNKLPLIIQEYVNGSGIDVSFLAYKGVILVWTVQKTLSDGGISFVDESSVLTMARKIVLGSSYTGIAHVDMISEKKSNVVKILEFNPRVWGSILGSKFAGINFLKIGSSVQINRLRRVQIKHKGISYISTRNFFKEFYKKQHRN